MAQPLPWGCLIPRSHGVSSRRRQFFRRAGRRNNWLARDITWARARCVFKWRLDSGRLLSIGPWNLGLVGPVLLGGYGESRGHDHANLLVAPPFSLAPLEPAVRLLLRQSSEWLGLGFASRCLAAWWYLLEGPPGEGRDKDIEAGEVLAAAVATVIARRTGLRVTTKATAERYGCALTATRAEITRVQALLRHAPAAGW